MRKFGRKKESSFHVDVEDFVYPHCMIKKADSKKMFLDNLQERFEVSFSGLFQNSPWYMGWNEEALFFAFHLTAPPPYTPIFPKYHTGDAIELFIDTRPVRSLRLLHRHCHHFLLFVEALDGVISREITEFRTEESRSLAENNSIFVDQIELNTKKKRAGLQSLVFIHVPREALFQGELEENRKLGFAYTITLQKALMPVISFPISSGLDQKSSPKLEKFPYRWATATLVL